MAPVPSTQHALPPPPPPEAAVLLQVAATATTGSGSAATEHTEEPQLAELVNEEAGFSCEIELKVIRNEIVEYTYPWNGNQVSSQKVQIMADRWQTGTTWFPEAPVPTVTIANEYGKAIVPRQSPFRSSSSDVLQSTLRCNVSF